MARVAPRNIKTIGMALNTTNASAHSAKNHSELAERKSNTHNPTTNAHVPIQTVRVMRGEVGWMWTAIRISR